MADQKPLLFLLAITLILSGVVSATGDDDQSSNSNSNSNSNVGGGAWQVVQQPENDPHVQAIIRFVLATQNALAKKQLVLERIIRVERYYATGIIEKLVIAAKDGGVTKTCEAVVLVKPWSNNYMKLTSFKIIV